MVRTTVLVSVLMSRGPEKTCSWLVIVLAQGTDVSVMRVPDSWS